MIKAHKITVAQPFQPKLSHDGHIMVVSLPISLRRQGGRKQVLTPADAAPWSPPPPRIDNTVVKALVRAHRWQVMLEAKLYASARDLAKAERINEAYLGRVLRLTLLSPAITEAILSGRQPDGLDLARMLKPFPIDWEKQEGFFLS
jgi:hypothetical protein